MSSTIFLCKQGGRTLWVPTHVATPSEASSPGGVHVLSSVTPTELSRAFYLFEHEISVVPDPQLARQTPNGKTPADVVKAITDLRQACAADASEALRRCYDPKRPAAQPAPASYMSMPQQQQPQQHQQQQPQHAASVMGAAAGGYLQPPSATSAMPTMNMSGYPQSTNNAPNVYPAPQQQQQSSSSFVGSGSQPPYNSYANPYGPPPPQPQSMMMPPYMNGPPPPQAGQMMGASAFYPMGPYGGAPGYEYSRGGRGGGRGRGGRGQGYMMNAYDGNMNAYGGGDMMGMGGMAAGVEPRRDAEPLQLPEVDVPEEVRNTYMNPQQPLVIASMPGPRLTAWLREFDVAATRGDRRFVPCRGGIILMLKARGAEVEKAKPVELLSKQICAHFLIHGYCSRPKCLHEHHTEEQVRELIACRHVELKAMTKKERQEKIQEILQREVEGEAEHEARRKEAIERRERGHAAYLERKAAAAAARGGGGVMSTADGNRAHDHQNARSPGNAASKPPVDLANLGVTDDDDDDDDSSNSSSSSSSSSSSASSGSRSASRERPALSEETAPAVSATATTIAADAQPEVPPVAEEETHAADAAAQQKPASKPSSKKPSPKPSPKISARKSPAHDEEAHSEAEADEEAVEHTDAEEEEGGDHDEHEHGEESEGDEEGGGHSEGDEEEDGPSKKAKKPAPKRKTAPAASKAKKKPAPKKRARSPAPKKAPAKRAKK